MIFNLNEKWRSIGCVYRQAILSVLPDLKLKSGQSWETIPRFFRTCLKPSSLIVAPPTLTSPPVGSIRPLTTDAGCWEHSFLSSTLKSRLLTLFSLTNLHAFFACYFLILSHSIHMGLTTLHTSLLHILKF